MSIFKWIMYAFYICSALFCEFCLYRAESVFPARDVLVNGYFVLGFSPDFSQLTFTVALTIGSLAAAMLFRWSMTRATSTVTA